MAKIGLKNFLFGVLHEAPDGTATYGAAQKPAKAISCNVSITNNDVSLYADDAIAETDTSFQNGTVTIGLDDENLDMMATLLGHTVTDGEIVRNSNDTAPYVGLGRIVTKMIGGALKYKVEFLRKVKFSEPSQDDNTKGETLEFGTMEIEGKIATLANGDWSKAKTFDSQADAQTYLSGLFGEAPATYTVTYNINGGSAGTPDPQTVQVGQSVTLNDGHLIMPPGTKHFAGWAKSPSATTATYAGGSTYTPVDDTTLYAVYADAE